MNFETNSTILVLEDEVVIAMDIEMTLEEAGYSEIAVCRTVDEAQACIEASAPRLAIVDLNLQRGQTSRPVTARLADLGVPFIVLSGDTGAGRDIPGIPTAAARIRKPFRAADLIAKVRSILGEN